MSGAFAGRVAVVTGGARGIGRATAARLLAAGDTLEIGDIDRVGLETGLRLQYLQ